MKKIAFLTSRNGGMIVKLKKGGLEGDVYSNKPNQIIEQRCKPKYFKDLSEIPDNYDVYLLCGYMKIIPSSWLKNKTCINFHPGKQDYKGLDPQIRMLNDYKKKKLFYAGGFVHFVDSGVDTGKVLFKCYERILKTDDVKSLTERLEDKTVDFLVRYLKELSMKQEAITSTGVRL